MPKRGVSMVEEEGIDLQKPNLRLVAAPVACLVVAAIAITGLITGNLKDLTTVWAAVLAIMGYAIVRDVQTK